ncbi:MAG: hypothetical protein FWG40_02605 [Peptococcaceae bacterium]|nr:hypothetical protein [Peptococcaceae bacterium]
MTSIPEKAYAEQSSIQNILHFCHEFQLSKAHKKAGAYKQKGVAVMAIL